MPVEAMLDMEIQAAPIEPPVEPPAKRLSLGKALVAAARASMAEGSDKKVNREISRVVQSALSMATPESSQRKRSKTVKLKKHFPGVTLQRLRCMAGSGGRPLQSYTTSEATLKEALQVVSTDCCRWSRKTNDIAYSLPASKKRTHFGLPEELKSQCSYRTMARRTAGGKLGFWVARKRVDVCSVCEAWEKKVMPQIQQNFHEAEHLLSNKCVGFFEGFDITPRYKVEDPYYCESFLEHLQEHVDSHDCPAVEDATFVRDWFEREKYQSTIANFAFHWSLAKSLRDAYTNDLQNLEPGATGLVYDFEAALLLCK
jgi:hypothetical protein